MFTDIEGSTRLWEHQPAAMAAALRRHDELLQDAIERAGGFTFKTVGDAFCAAFSSVTDAVDAVTAAQRALHGEPWLPEVSLRVRMALHTGECEERNGDYYGPTVNRTARLEAIAHGGQVLVSGPTSALLADRLPVATELVSLGEYRLKDLERPEQVFQLTIEGLPSTFPPLRSVGAATVTNLTESISSFIGRDDEVEEILGLMGHHRLVTLIGSGGVGKTRLANEVARRMLGHRSEGVWSVELAAVTDDASVATAALTATGILQQPGRTDLDTLADVLATQDRMLLLDNCEHLLDGVAVLADRLLRHCPGVHLLATSRAPLSVEGESLYRVPSLSLPGVQVRGLADLEGSGAVALFLERATAQVPGFAVDDDTAPVVASLCRRLDGMPLAVELATARLRSMSLGQLDARLERRFDLLTGGSRSALPRQQTLRAMVDWSYDLLTSDEQRLLRRASVFMDGCDLEAIEWVCTLDDIDEFAVADLVGSLVDKSLVVAEPAGEGLRYRLLETLREYGVERMADLPAGSIDEANRVTAAHANYYLSLAEQAGPRFIGPEAAKWFDRLQKEERNLRTAIEYTLLIPGGADRVLEQFWLARSHWAQATQSAQAFALLEAATAMATRDPDPRRQVQLALAQSVLLESQDHRRQLAVLLDAVEPARRSGDLALEAETLALVAEWLSAAGRRDESVRFGQEALSLARSSNDRVLLGRALFHYGTALVSTAPVEAEHMFAEALGLVEQTGDRHTASKIYNNLGLALLNQRKLPEARRAMAACVELFGPGSSLSGIPIHNLAEIALQERDPEEAALGFAEALRLDLLSGSIMMIPGSVMGVARCAAQRGNLEHAAVLAGGADGLLALHSGHWAWTGEQEHSDLLEDLRMRLGDAFGEAYARGRAMASEDVIRLATHGSEGQRPV